MAKYRLLAAHYLEMQDTTMGSALLMGDKENENLGEEKGVIVGDGTPYKVKWPTLEMAALDEEAEKMLEKERERLTKNDASMNPIDELSLEDAWEKDYIPGSNLRRRAPLPDGSPARMKK